MLRKLSHILLLAGAVLTANAALAENPNAGITYTTVTTCAPDTTVTTATPYTVCTPYTVTTNLGYNRCSVGGDRASASGDFAMGGTCSTATSTSIQQACSVAYNYSTSIVKGACTTTQVPVSDGGNCQTQSHHCNNGGGPGG